MGFHTLLAGDAVDHGVQIRVLSRYDPGLHDHASNQTARLCVSSHYGCHRTLLGRPEGRHNQHQYKTRSQSIVPQMR
jgi:hypothetical protein